MVNGEPRFASDVSISASGAFHLPYVVRAGLYLVNRTAQILCVTQGSLSRRPPARTGRFRAFPHETEDVRRSRSGVA